MAIEEIPKKSLFDDDNLTKDSSEIEMYEQSKKTIIMLDLLKQIQKYMTTFNPDIVKSVMVY